MKQLKRALLLIAAIAVGGGLGKLLLDNVILFGIACLLLGEIFHQIDVKIAG